MTKSALNTRTKRMVAEVRKQYQIKAYSLRGENLTALIREMYPMDNYACVYGIECDFLWMMPAITRSVHTVKQSLCHGICYHKHDRKHTIRRKWRFVYVSKHYSGFLYDKKNPKPNSFSSSTTLPFLQFAGFRVKFVSLQPFLSLHSIYCDAIWYSYTFIISKSQTSSL